LEGKYSFRDRLHCYCRQFLLRFQSEMKDNGSRLHCKQLLGTQSEMKDIQRFPSSLCSIAVTRYSERKSEGQRFPSSLLSSY